MGAEACWVDLTDYLRRLVLLFDPRPIRTRANGHADLRQVLPRFEGLAELTGRPEWGDLANQIRSAYKQADRDGWEAVDPGWSAAVRYDDHFAGFRAAAGRKASQLVRANAAHISDRPSLVPAAPVDHDRYDPPKPAPGETMAALVGTVVLAGVAALALWMFGAPQDIWFFVEGSLLFTAFVLAASGWITRDD